MTLPEDKVLEFIYEAAQGLVRNKYPIEFQGVHKTLNGIFNLTFTEKNLHTVFKTDIYPTTYDPDKTIQSDLYTTYPEGTTDELRVLFRIAWHIKTDWQNCIYDYYDKHIAGVDDIKNWVNAWAWYKKNY